MKIQILFCFLVSSALFSVPFDDVAPSSSEEIASLNASLSVEGFVSPLSGQVSLHETDLLVRGAQDVRLNRSYLSPHVFGKYKDREEEDRFYLAEALSSQQRNTWVVFPHLFSGYNPYSPYFQLCDPSGFVLEFEIQGAKGILKTESFGFSNLRNEEPNAAADLRNIEFVMEPQSVRVTWPDGTERVYRRISTLFRLEKELLPNGKSICYQYGPQGKIKVTASDAEGKYLYGSIEQVNENHYVGSDGREVRFDRVSVKIGGKKKEHRGKRSFSLTTQLLSGVQGPYYDHLLRYNDRTLLSFYDAKSLSRLF